MKKVTITDFLHALNTKSDFAGDIGDYTDTIVQAVDNSIYERLPKAVIYPASKEDLQTLLRLSCDKHYESLNLHFAGRGGGTGTNAQSLTDGILVDVSKHMNHILHVDASNKEVTVQPGVTLEQLNTYLKPLGYFFPPTVSSGSRATLGGMVSTDASGMGSRIYGKTSAWINEISTLLYDATAHTFKPIALSDWQNVPMEEPLSTIYEQIKDSVTTHREMIESVFPKMNRGLTGYNLKHTLEFRDSDQPNQPTHLNPCYLIAGSEGTLCFITEIKCRIETIPKYQAVATVIYENLQTAIDSVNHLIKADPTAIEFINDNIVEMAKQDACWQDLLPFIQDEKEIAQDQPIGGINFVQLTANSEVKLAEHMKKLEKCLEENQQSEHPAVSWHIAHSIEAVNHMWHFRQKAQGLIAAPKGRKRSIAFIEDTAVPVENLPTFIHKLQQLFKKYHIKANIYGHADVGCVHVRPDLDLTDFTQKKRIRELSDEVFELSKSLGGLIWGEHGKGVRGEYNPSVFGDTLYAELQKIKRAFDPYNRLNPGKVTTPFYQDKKANNKPALLKLDKVPMRADIDAKILSHYENSAYTNAIYCNGNGACYHWDVDEPMCPSYKVTRDRRHSPKGRAMLLREWLRQSLQSQDTTYAKFSQAIRPIMDNCLGCAACTHQCPLHVNIPDMRAHFYHQYYQSHLRPLKDYFIAHIETIAAFIGERPWLAQLINTLQKNTLIQYVLKQSIGIIDPPVYSVPTLRQQMQSYEYRTSKQTTTKPHTPHQIILIADCFNRYYDANVVMASLKLLQKLGIHVRLAPPLANGKAQHIKGFLTQYRQTAIRNHQQLLQWASQGATLVGLDSSMTLTYQHDYIKQFGQNMPKVLLLHEWLAQHIAHLSSTDNTQLYPPSKTHYQLLAHCCEHTAANNTGTQWQSIFRYFNLSLNIKKLGCCGMAGSFGHEVSNEQSSQQAYSLSWQPHIEKHHLNSAMNVTLLASGFSCRSQVKRYSNHRLPHPIEILSKL